MRPRHFPQSNRAGTFLLGESGGREEEGKNWILVNDHEIALGYGPPTWSDDSRFLFSRRTGTFVYDLITGSDQERVHPTPLIELAACPALWAGRDPQRNVLIVSDGRVIPNAGQPWIASDGSLVYRTGDDMIEPTCGGGNRAWGDGRAVHVMDSAGRGRSYVGEFRPRLVSTPDGWALLTMTHTALRLRRNLFDDHLGWAREFGDNKNLNASVVCIGLELRVVCQDGAGNLQFWNQHMDARRERFDVPPPPPPPPPKEPLVEPNYRAEIDALARQYHELITRNTTSSIGLFVEIAAWTLAQKDPRVGHVGKPPNGGTQWNGHAVNCIAVQLSPTLHRVVQIVWLAEAGNHDAPPADRGKPGQPTWDPKSFESNRADNPWRPAFQPSGIVTVPDNPPPPPPPTNQPDFTAILRRLDAQDAEIAKLRAELRKRIALKGAHGRYLCAENEEHGFRVIADRRDRGSWEIFEVERISE